MEKLPNKERIPNKKLETGIFRDKATVRHSGKEIFRKKCQKWNPNQETSGEKCQYQEPGRGISRNEVPNKKPLNFNLR
jgi:hypothetical protein